MKAHLLAAAAAALGLVPHGAFAQDKTVTLMHVETDPGIISSYERIAAEFEAAHPGVDIEIKFLENQAFKSKLTTLLQSDARPDIFYSWGGGVFEAQAEAGVLRDISDLADDEWRATLSPAALSAFTASDGKLYGAPFKITQVGFWYNKALLEKAGVTPEDLATWDGFLAAVRKIKDAGITPIALGGGDQWPTHFYWANLIVRLGGAAAIPAAKAGEGDGFAAPVFVEAAEMLKELADLEPFQNGFASAKYGEASGYFGDGKAAMHLMGNWDYATAKVNSSDKAGVPDDNLGWVPFPQVEDGAGAPGDTLGGVNGFLVSRGAPDEAVEFVKFFVSPENQAAMAAAGDMIPVAKGADSALKNPYFAEMARNIAASEYHQLFLDQDLGPDVGRAFNDASAAIVNGSMTPEEAAESVQESWDMNQ